MSECCSVLCGVNHITPHYTLHYNDTVFMWPHQLLLSTWWKKRTNAAISSNTSCHFYGFQKNHCWDFKRNPTKFTSAVNQAEAFIRFYECFLFDLPMHCRDIKHRNAAHKTSDWSECASKWGRIFSFEQLTYERSVQKPCKVFKYQWTL